MLQQCNCFTTNVHVLHAHFVTRDFGIRDCCYCYCFVIVIVICYCYLLLLLLLFLLTLLLLLLLLLSLVLLLLLPVEPHEAVAEVSRIRNV